MNINTPLCIILSFLLTRVSQAQPFITKGTITFERKVQMHKILEDNEWVKANMASIPKFYLSTFQLHFNEDTLLYHKVGEDEPNSASWAIFARENEVVTIFSTGQSVVKKTVYNDDFMIKDSLPKYRWKLVNETRKIAGVECKKATTIINDSVFVVAFYAETILVSGGPEQFCGLPGMILGVIVPRLHVSYYAQKMEREEKQQFSLPKHKGKTMKRKEFQEMVLKNMKWAFSNSAIGALYLFL